MSLSIAIDRLSKGEFMRRTRIVQALFLCGIAALFGSIASATEFRGGTSEYLKTFGTRTNDDTKAMQNLKIIYFYDDGPRANNFAEKLEGKEFFANEDVQAAIKKITKLKVKYDGTGPAKGWSQLMRDRSKNAAAILLMSSDNVYQIWFDQHSPRETLTTEGFLAGVKSVEDYDRAHKPDAEKDKDKDKVASKKEEPAANDALKFKGIPVSNDDKPKTPAPPPAAPTTPKSKGPADE